MGLAGRTSRTQIAKGVGMGKRQLVKGMRCRVSSRPSFTDNNGVSCFDGAWPRKATDIVGGKSGNVS